MIDTELARPWPLRIAAIAGTLLIAIGLTVLAGWITGTSSLIQILPTLPPMTRNTAACFLLCGLAVLTRTRGGRRGLVVASAGTALVISALTVVEILFRVDAGIDELLGSSYISTALRSPGRMAPLTSICIALASAGLLLAPGVLSPRSAPLLGLAGSIVTACGLAASIGFWGNVTLAAFHTAVGLAILGAGLLALAWHVEADRMLTPRWLPISVAIGVIAATIGLWRALILGGYAPFALLPGVVIIVGCLIAPIFALTVYLAQHGHAQATALRRSEAFLVEGQRLSRTGSFAWRMATGDITWSEQLYRIYGFDPAAPVTLEMIGRRFHPDDQPLLSDMIGHARDDGSDFEYEHRLQMPDLSVKHLHIVAHGTRDAGGRREYIGAIQDVTDRRLSEDALGRARSELAHVARVTTIGALTASIAHEVNQPLSGIVTNAGTCLRMLAADPPNIDGARDTARRTIRDGNRASEVIARLRALFSKKDAATESVDLNEATREVVALSMSELQRHRVIVQQELAAELPAILGDRVQLQQVILNLLLNASEAMNGIDDRPRQLVIRTASDDGNRVRLTVTDAGVGFGPHELERVFEAFYSTKRGGMGIGLSVSRSIIDSHRGRLWAAPNEGHGATFAFSIPCGAAVPIDTIVQ